MLRSLLILSMITACGTAPTEGAPQTSDPTDSGTGAFNSSIDAQRAAKVKGQALLPTRIDYLAAGPAFAATIYVGGTALEVVLDTGSSGLRILEGTIPESEFVVPETGAHVTQAFGSGSVFTGPVATAYITIAGMVTPSPIKVQRVQGLSCTAAKPNCPSANADPATHLIKGAYRAVMGIGMRNAANGVGSPIAQLAGEPAYIFTSNGPYGSTAGHVLIGPTPALRRFFAPIALSATGGITLANGVPAYDDRAINVCVLNYTYGNTFCAPALLDSGAAQTTITFNGASSQHMMPAGSYVEYDYYETSDPSSAIVASFAFSVGSPQQPGLDDVEILPTSADSSMNTGTITFFNTRVLFDQANGIIGMAAPAW